MARHKKHIPYLSVTDRTSTQHEGTEHLAIHNTFFRRFLALLALKTVGKCYKELGFCVPVSKHIIIKTGPYVHLTEATTTKFVADNTSIPVPKIYCSFIRKNRAYIVMQRIQGDELPRGWGKLSEESRQNVLDQLKRMIQELRALEPPVGMGVASCTGGSLRDSRIPRSCPRFGPFNTIQEFHLWLREDLKSPSLKDRENDPVWLGIKKMVDKQDGPWSPPVFTHADLSPFNIMIRGDQVVGLIDWELSGWYPSYWEYTSAWLSSITRTDWRASVDKFLDPFPEALEMEATRQKWWGEF